MGPGREEEGVTRWYEVRVPGIKPLNSYDSSKDGILKT